MSAKGIPRLPWGWSQPGGVEAGNYGKRAQGDLEAGADLKARGSVHSRPGISINKGRTGFFTRLWEDRGKAGTGPGQGPELCEEVCVRSHAAVGRGNECQEPLRTSHVPEAWMPQGRQRWNPLDNFSLQLIQLLSRLSPLQVEGPRAWRGHPCPRGKSGGRSKRQNLLPHRGERRGVCLLQLLGQPSRLGPQRSLRDRTPPVRGQIFRSMGSCHRGCADNPPLHPSAPGRALSGAAEMV